MSFISLLSMEENMMTLKVEENHSEFELTEDENYICNTLDDLDLQCISEYNLFLDKNKIDDFYKKSFSKDWQANNNKDFTNSTSQASAFFKMIIDRYSSFLFSKFPEIEAEEKIKSFLLSKENQINSALEKIVKEYVLYGCSVVQIVNNDLASVDDYEGWYFYKELLIKSGDLTADEESAEALYLLLEGVEFDIKEAFVVYYNNKKYLYNNKYKNIVELPDTETSNFCVIFDKKPLVNYVYDLFLALEKLYMDKLKALDLLKVLAIYPASQRKTIEEIFKKNFVGIPVSGSDYALNANNAFNYVSNAPISETINILSSQIAEIKQDIITILDKQDLFNGLSKDNPNETRVAAANRVAISQINVEANQRKFNDFIERILKFYSSKHLNCAYSDIDLEVNSISILRQEQEQLAEEAENQKIISLLTQASQVQPPISNIYYGLLYDIVEKSNYLSNKDFLINTINAVKAQQQEMLVMQMQQAQQPNPEVILIDAKLEEMQAKTNKMNMETAEIQSKISVEKTLKAKEIEVKEMQERRKIIDEEQQMLDAETRNMKARNMINGGNNE